MSALSSLQQRRGRASVFGLALMACVTATQAAPFTPAADAEIVERLPARPDAATRRERAALARAPQQLALALSVARAAIDRARRQGDPRELGAAQAALAPWWNQPAAPPAVRLLRGVIRQSQHDFDGALADLDALAADDRLPLPLQAQAGLTRAAVLQVAGRWSEAAAACQTLQQDRYAPLGAPLAVPARACELELRSLVGQPGQAAAQLAALARNNPGDSWLALVRAELAQRLGDDAAASRLFSAATAVDPDPYALAAHADWLLDQGRPQQALDLLARGPAEADALLLRRAIALQRLHDPRAAAAVADLQARFAAARQRGQSLHAREEARLALDLVPDPPAALALALQNWQHQREPADAVLLARAAAAAGQPQQALPALRAWTADPAAVDVRLAAVMGVKARATAPAPGTARAATGTGTGTGMVGGGAS